MSSKRIEISCKIFSMVFFFVFGNFWGCAEANESQCDECERQEITPHELGALIHPINITDTPPSGPIFLQSTYPGMSQTEGDKFNDVLRLLFTLGESNYARLLEQHAKDGKITFGEMASDEGGDTSATGHITINQSALQTAGTRPMNLGQKLMLATTLIHEYSHTLQSYLEKWQADVCPGNFCEVEAWGAGIGFLARATNKMVDDLKTAQANNESAEAIQEKAIALKTAAGAFTTYESLSLKERKDPKTETREGAYRPWTNMGRGSGDYTWTDSAGTKFSSEQVSNQASKIASEADRILNHDPSSGPTPTFTENPLPEMSSTGIGSYTTPPEAPRPTEVYEDTNKI